MDYKQVFLGIVVCLLVVVGSYTFATHLNSKYVPLGATPLETTFYDDFYGDMSGYTGDLSVDIGESSESSSVSTDPTQTAILSSRGTFSTIRSLMGFVPMMFEAAGEYLGIPAIYTDLATWAFVFVFGLTMAYLIFLGVRKLVT